MSATVDDVETARASAAAGRAETGPTAQYHRLPAHLRLLRPRQWVKNGFVLAPLIFSGSFLNPGSVVRALFAMVLFCMASSATYIFNDLNDLEADRRHPEKRHQRPIASGEVSVAHARVLGLFLAAAVVAAGLLQPWTLGVVLLYMALTTLYSVKLKHVPVVDLFVLAVGFVLRVWAGAVAVGVVLSGWMFITTLSLALYLAAVKRQAELEVTHGSARQVLQLYSATLLERYASLAAVSAIVFYGLFVVTVRPELVITIPLVLFGLFRYWYLAEVDQAESPTDALWGDWILIATVLLWGGLSTWAVWPK